MSVLSKNVLVLNRNWQAINMVSMQHALLQVACGAATALDVSPAGIIPMQWDAWIHLPVRDGDDFIRTQHRDIRALTVISCVAYAKIKMRSPKFCTKTIRERDQNRCQYTGKLLKPEDGSIDHVLPRSKGGEDTFENCVWASKDVNSKKGNRLNEEVGLKPLKKPVAPKQKPPAAFIKPEHPDHLHFLTHA